MRSMLRLTQHIIQKQNSNTRYDIDLSQDECPNVDYNPQKVHSLILIRVGQNHTEAINKHEDHYAHEIGTFKDFLKRTEYYEELAYLRNGYLQFCHGTCLEEELNLLLILVVQCFDIKLLPGIRCQIYLLVPDYKNSSYNLGYTTDCARSKQTLQALEYPGF